MIFYLSFPDHWYLPFGQQVSHMAGKLLEMRFFGYQVFWDVSYSVGTGNFVFTWWKTWLNIFHCLFAFWLLHFLWLFLHSYICLLLSINLLYLFYPFCSIFPSSENIFLSPCSSLPFSFILPSHSISPLFTPLAHLFLFGRSALTFLALDI